MTVKLLEPSLKDWEAMKDGMSVATGAATSAG
jgi:hypothetical protein